eukprot:CAMPEP_0115827412 /NCGR_PEP_ID=MMETSP0287-20121206/29_1 /TAXON_ID=412157 /ORGANISM="Chrysochromulina rotalis, Strain UIO044" /LENGTH=90 /DNA_ID=CAMNT_0003280565 /DNA_START=634 /DNA_END=902 /DNA_ORIENTATION=-
MDPSGNKFLSGATFPEDRAEGNCISWCLDALDDEPPKIAIDKYSPQSGLLPMRRTHPLARERRNGRAAAGCRSVSESGYPEMQARAFRGA